MRRNWRTSSSVGSVHNGKWGKRNGEAVSAEDFIAAITPHAFELDKDSRAAPVALEESDPLGPVTLNVCSSSD